MTTKPVEEKKAASPKEEKPAKVEKKSNVIKLEVKPASEVKGEWDPADPEAPTEPVPDVAWPPIQDNSPQLVIRGKVVEPVATGVKTDSEGLQYKGIKFYLPWPIRRFADLSFNIYEIENNGQTLHLAMDETSKFVIETDPRHFHFVPGNGQLKASAVATMINSTSTNDFFVGESTLINVESCNNVVNNSHLEATKREQGRRWFGMEENEGSEFKPGENRRHAYTGCRFKRTRVENSLLDDGYYLETFITDSEIQSKGRVNVRGGRVSRTRLLGGDITLGGATLVNVNIHCSGQVQINRLSMNNEHFNVPGLHLVNKFAHTAITIPHYSDLRLVRVSPTEFDLSDGLNSTTIKLDETGGEISEKVENLFRRIKGKLPNETPRNRFDCVGVDGFTRSILNYVTDSVVSRLRIIEMIDSAAETLATVVVPPNQFEPYSTPFDL